MNNRPNKFIPLIISLSLIAGLLLGSFYANHFNGNHLSIINASSNKINDLLHIIDDQYVDKVELGDLVEKAMPSILSELDPHSSYISAKDVEQEMQIQNIILLLVILVILNLKKDNIFIKVKLVIYL